MQFPSRATVEHLKEIYPVGTRVVKGVDDTASILVRWDNGSGLNVVYGEDEIRKI